VNRGKQLQWSKCCRGENVRPAAVTYWSVYRSMSVKSRRKLDSTACCDFSPARGGAMSAQGASPGTWSSDKTESPNGAALIFSYIQSIVSFRAAPLGLALFLWQSTPGLAPWADIAPRLWRSFRIDMNSWMKRFVLNQLLRWVQILPDQ